MNVFNNNFFENNNNYLSEENIYENNNNKNSFEKTNNENNIILNNKINNNNNQLLSKKKLFSTEKVENNYSKQIKLLQNRMSAKNSRLKKKNYLKSLENQLNLYKSQIDYFKKIFSLNFNLENSFLNLKKIEDYCLNNNLSETKLEEKKLEYNKIQNFLKKEYFIRLIKIFLPLECKIFFKKLLKLELINDNDTLFDIQNKVNKNIIFLEQIYNFKDNNIINENNYKSNNISIKLFNYFCKLKNMIDLFISFQN